MNTNIYILTSFNFSIHLLSTLNYYITELRSQTNFQNTFKENRNEPCMTNDFSGQLPIHEAHIYFLEGTISSNPDCPGKIESQIHKRVAKFLTSESASTAFRLIYFKFLST